MSAGERPPPGLLLRLSVRNPKLLQLGFWLSVNSDHSRITSNSCTISPGSRPMGEALQAWRCTSFRRSAICASPRSHQSFARAAPVEADAAPSKALLPDDSRKFMPLPKQLDLVLPCWIQCRRLGQNG